MIGAKTADRNRQADFQRTAIDPWAAARPGSASLAR